MAQYRIASISILYKTIKVCVMRLSAAYLVAEIQKIYLIKIIALYKKNSCSSCRPRVVWVQEGRVQEEEWIVTSWRVERTLYSEARACAKYTNSFLRGDNFTLRISHCCTDDVTSWINRALYFSATIGTVSRKTNPGAIRERPLLAFSFPQLLHAEQRQPSHAT